MPTRIVTSLVYRISDEPGGLAWLTRAVTDSGVNIVCVSGRSTGRGGAVVEIVVSDRRRAEAAVKSAKNLITGQHRWLKEQRRRPSAQESKPLRLAEGCRFDEERRLLVTTVRDRVGELNKKLQRLDRKGVNVDSIFVVGRTAKRVDVAMHVDHLARAKRALS
jgi:hypothetical protein